MANKKIRILTSEGITTGWEGPGSLSVEAPATFTSTATMSGDTLMTGTTTVQGIQKHTNASGKYVNGLNVVTKQAAWSSGSTIASGAIYVPADCVITKLTAIVQTALVFDSGAVTVMAGSSAGDNTYATAANLDASGTGVAAGVGMSTTSHFTTALGGAANLVLVATTPYIDTAGEVHMTATAAGGDFSAGTMIFVVEFIYTGGN
jgi:hypothetical protein